jgi:hypothetical protein
MAQTPPQAAISYAQSYRRDDVLELSNRLRRDGVKCEIDQYEPAPEVGWGRFMSELMKSRTVLVVCSEPYLRRYHLREERGVGLGATFESGILVQRVIESQGRNTSIIPVLLDSADAQFIPDFLRDVTRYDLSRDGEYEKLLRRLTDRPYVVRPPVGEIPHLPTRDEPVTAARPRNLVLFRTESSLFGMPLIEVERAEGLRMIVAADNQSDVAHLRALRGERHHFSVAYRLTATFARVQSIRELMRDGEERIELDLAQVPFDNSLGTEMSYNGVSADKIAEMRARRILLDENPPPPASGQSWGDEMQSMLFESILSGSSSIGDRLSVKGSPITAIARDMDVRNPDFVPVARLLCVMTLILSGTVEHIVRLDVEPETAGVRVRFEGVRHKAYSNVEPTRISVEGVCPLDSAAS